MDLLPGLSQVFGALRNAPYEELRKLEQKVSRYS
jgi:hypothetical protein